MSKKSAFTCFILCIAIILSLAFSACGSTKVDNTTGPSSSTEATNNTTSASEPAETTSNSTASTSFETTETTTQALWQPDLIGDVWNFNPLFPHKDVDLNDYDIELSTDKTVYTEIPDSISIKIVNKTGKPFWMCIATYLEKANAVEGSPGSGYDLPRAPVWVRLPYYVWPAWAEFSAPEMSWTIDLTDNCKYWEAPYKFTKGEYRLVVFFPDGPQYAYFEITGSSS